MHTHDQATHTHIEEMESAETMKEQTFVVVVKTLIGRWVCENFFLCRKKVKTKMAVIGVWLVSDNPKTTSITFSVLLYWIYPAMYS